MLERNANGQRRCERPFVYLDRLGEFEAEPDERLLDGDLRLVVVEVVDQLRHGVLADDATGLLRLLHRPRHQVAADQPVNWMDRR